MATEDSSSEQLDDDTVGAEYPPERPIGGVLHEQRGEQPDADVDIDGDGEELAEDRPVLLLDETEDGFGLGGGDVDESGDAVLGEAGDSWPAAGDGPQLGPPRSDLASDRVPLDAEEAAVHVVDEGRA